MTQTPFYSPEQRPTVLLFSEGNSLGISLIEKLLASFCKVKVLSKDKNTWKDKVEHLKDNRFLEIQDISLAGQIFSAQYTLFVNNDFKKSFRDLKNAIVLSEKLGAKTLFVLPFSTETEEQRELVLKTKDLASEEGVGTIYLGDLLGPRISLSEGSLVTEIIRKAFRKETLEVNMKGEIYLYPVSVADASREIVRSLLSFGSSEEGLAIISKKITLLGFVEEVRQILPGISLILTKTGLTRQNDKDSKKNYFSIDISRALHSTYDWIKSSKDLQVLIKESRKNSKTQNNLPNKLSYKKFSQRQIIFLSIASFVGFVLTTFFLILVLSIGSFFIGIRFSVKGSLSAASKSFAVSQRVANISQYLFGVFSKTPVVGRIFSFPQYFSIILEEGANIGQISVQVGVRSKELVGKIFGQEIYDPVPLCQELALDLDNLYKKTGFLQGELISWRGIKAKILRKFLNMDDLNSLRAKISAGKDLAEDLPEILGKSKPQKYLILFQNNMELRPTGGFIGSFAILSLDSGRLGEINISDVYAADGQLKGHIEPPVAIKKYLGEAGWYLRDSNWDPDFSISAARAEWFLDKEIDQSVDGVVAIDLEAVKNLLKIIGPLYLSDFQQEINYENFYEKTQEEVESNFFPGSYKKTSFLTSLAKELTTKISSDFIGQYFSLASALIDSLSQRHIQIFLHRTKARKAVAALGFDGSISIPDCQQNCYMDWLGLVDANVGVNKANYFIQRNASFSVFFDGQSLKRVLIVNFENKANISLGEKAKYRTYLRLLSPQEVSVNAVEFVSNEDKNSLPFETEDIRGRKETGVYLEIEPGQKRSVIFYWQNIPGFTFDKEGVYGLYWRKQAGTVGDKISVNISLPWGTRKYISDNLNLTKDGVFVYNNNLTRDFFSRIYW